MKRFAWKFLNAVAVLLVALGILLAVPAALVLHPVAAAIAVALIACGFALGLSAGRALGVRFMAKGEGNDAPENYAEPFDHIAATYNDLDTARVGTNGYWAVHAGDAWKRPSA